MEVGLHFFFLSFFYSQGAMLLKQMLRSKVNLINLKITFRNIEKGIYPIDVLKHFLGALLWCLGHLSK